MSETERYMCDECSHDADCEIPEQRTFKEGCDMFLPVDLAERDMKMEPPEYTVTDIIHGFEDMFRRSMDDLSHELGKHGLAVADWHVHVTDHPSPYGNTPPIESQTFEVRLDVKSRGRPGQ